MLIRTKLLISIAIPCLSLLTVGVIKSWYSVAKAQQMKETINLVELSTSISSFVHEAQKERGLTAGFLGSKGTKLGAELRSQHGLTDERLKDLFAAVEGIDREAHPDFVEALDATLARLDRIEKVRDAALAQRVGTSEAIGYYTQNHTELLNLIGSLAGEAADPSVISRLAAYSAFLKGKERAGIERAVLSAVYSADEFSGGQFERVVQLAAEQEAFYGEFAALADKQDAIDFEEIKSGAIFNQTLEMRESALARVNEGDFGVDPAAWFGLMTEKIDELKQFEDKLAQDLVKLATAAKSSAQGDLAFASLSSLLTLLASVITGIYVMRSITNPVNAFAKAADDLAQGSNVESVEVSSDDELGALATSLNQFFMNLKKTNAEAEEQMAIANDYRAQVETICKTQIFIELNCKGEISDVNQQFIQSFGYDRDTAVGKHHRELVPEEDRRSDEHREFWKYLNQGESRSGEFRRIDSNGNDVWMSAVYAPIVGEDGEPKKVVVFALDITATKTAMEESRVKDHEQTTQLTALMNEVGIGASQIDLGSQQIARASQSLSSGAAQQASSLQEIITSLDEMSSMTDRNAEHCREAAGLSGECSDSADRGQSEMSEMTSAMSEIMSSSSEISKIIKVIDEIAFQTNLLALNAAVEAARAGEAGKGFAVVAEEVRNLAQRSAEAAKNTSTMIEESNKRAENGVQIAERVGEALEDIVSSTQKVNSLVTEIAAASQEQAQGISQINTGVTQLDSVTQQNAANSEELAANAEETAAQISSLQELVTQFNGPESVGTPQGPTLSLTSVAPQSESPLSINPSSDASNPSPESLIPFDENDRAIESF